MTNALQLHELPHRQARTLLERGTPVFFSIDPIEFHGPHLSLRNDYLVSTGLSRRIAPALAEALSEDFPCVLASALDAGCDPTPGPGTHAVSFKRLVQLVEGACASLAALGARRVVLMTFHGAPLHSIALQRGVDLLRKRGCVALAPLNLLMADVATADPMPFAPALAHIAEPEREFMLRNLRHDFHAGFMETSFALALAPHSVDASHRTLPDCPAIEPDLGFMKAARIAEGLGNLQLASELRVAAWGIGWSKLRPFWGYTGQPRHATVESGEVFVRYAVQRSVTCIQEVFRGATPPPAPMAWMESLTLRGRVPGMNIPLDAIRTP